MCSHCWNKLIVVSLALAVAGVLMCAVALLDVFIPRGSVAGFLVSMTLLAIIVTGVVISYTWACDKCESYFTGRLDRLLSRSQPNRSETANLGSATSTQPAEPRGVGDPRFIPGTPQPPAPSERYGPTLC
jgi:hypothetical protein